MTKIVWILNISHDSFSDGRLYTRDELHKRILELIDDGANIIDVGAESTAPGSTPIWAEEEHQRLKDFFALLQVNKYPIPFSLDTTKASIASLGIQSGVTMINDVSGGRVDPDMLTLIAQTGISYVIMYCKDPSGRASHDMVKYPNGIIPHLIQYFDQRVGECLQAGIGRSQIILDPGMGKFVSNDYRDSITVLQSIALLKQNFQLPVYIGTSRKWFLKEITPDHGPVDRVGSSLASSLYAMTQGADYLRVHDVRWMRQTIDTRLALQAVS